MRKKYIRPEAYSVYIEETELICESNVYVHNGLTYDYNKLTWKDGVPGIVVGDQWLTLDEIEDYNGGTAKPSICWDDSDVAPW